MTKYAFLLLFTLAVAGSYAQETKLEFGKVSQEELDLKVCDFEKDANAMVLFDKGDVYFDQAFNIIMERQRRIKILNDKGKDQANIRIKFYGGFQLETITNIQAQTINLENGKPEIIKVERNLIYTQTVDKVEKAIVFSFPNVRAGSIIEYKYTWKTTYVANFPSWAFQDEIPIKYSELTTAIPDMLIYSLRTHVRQPLTKNEHQQQNGRIIGTGTDAVTYGVDVHTMGLANIPSFQDEPYMSSRKDNLNAASFQLTTIRPVVGFPQTYSDSWPKVGGILAEDEDFGAQLKKKLNGEDPLIAKAKLLKTDEQKIDFLFNEVRSVMKWNGVDQWYTNNGTTKAWDTKTGNSAEINLILYHLLKQSGVTVYPMIVSTREHGKVNAWFPSLTQFNKAVVFAPLNDQQFYVLDATDKDQGYQQIPDNLLNSSAFYIDKEKKVYEQFQLTNEVSAQKTVFIQGEIAPTGKLTGNVKMSSFSYHRVNDLKEYKRLGDEKYKQQLINSDNNVKVVSMKLENTGIDSLPFVQNIDFTYTMNNDGDYIYVPSLFFPLRANPFLSEERVTNVDFSHLNTYLLSGVYKIPPGYKVDALPENVVLNMPDQSISFKRFIAAGTDQLTFRLSVIFNTNFFLNESYAELRNFYKKMFEMIGEQIVLRKSQ